MKKVITIVIVVGLLAVLTFSIGRLRGGASIRLEGVSLSGLNMEGKPVGGLPSDKINVVLDVGAQSITIKYSPDGSVLTLEPSGATIEIKASGVAVKGVKPEETRIEWIVPKTTK